MSTSKAKNSEPVKNNGGTIKAKGSFSSLSQVVNNNDQTNQVIVGSKFGATFLTNSNFINQRPSNPNNEHYRNQLLDEGAYPSGIDFVTGQPERLVSFTGDFTLASGRPDNIIDNYYFLIGEPQKFIPNRGSVVTEQSVSVVADSTNYFAALSASLSNNLRSITLSNIPSTVRSVGLFSGPVSIYNEFHEKNFTVIFNSGSTPLYSGNHVVDAWKKKNFNLPANTSSVTISTPDDSGETFGAGFGSGLLQATTQTRTVSITDTRRTNPITYNPSSANVILVSGEKAIQVPCTSGALQLTIREIDSAGTKTPATYYVIPNGSTGTYYPTYTNVCIAENQGKSFTVQVLN